MIRERKHVYSIYIDIDSFYIISYKLFKNFKMSQEFKFQLFVSLNINYKWRFKIKAIN